MSEFDPTRLDEFVRWGERWTTPLGEWNYLHQHVSVTSATLFARLMFPEFIEVRGCVIVREVYNPETFEQWWRRSNCDPRTVEHNVNRLTLWDWWEPDGAQEEAALEFVATRIAISWKVHATLRFPHISWETYVDDVYGPVVALGRAS